MFEIYKRPQYPELIKHIMMNWAALGLPETDLTKLTCKIAAARKSGFNSLMTFIMSAGGKPLVVIKCPRYGESKPAADSLKTEAKVLKALSATSLKDSAPPLYLFESINGLAVLVTGGVAGGPFNELLDRENDSEKLDSLLSLGIRPAFELAGIKDGRSVEVDDTFIEEHIRKPLAAVCEYFPQHIEMIEGTCSKVLALCPKSALHLKECFVHNDFNPWNLLGSDKDSVCVIDWEDAVYDGLPLMDFFNYYIVAHRILFMGETPYSRSRTAEQKTKRAQVLLENYKKNLGLYCKASNIPPELEDLLFLVFAAEISAFFVNEKRKSISYAESWVSILLNLKASNCFESYIRKMSGL
ncbi:MAG: aminoglycoside phosphotransferase family protein [Candidatus Margulisiibacteriota bacterium]